MERYIDLKQPMATYPSQLYTHITQTYTNKQIFLAVFAIFLAYKVTDTIYVAFFGPLSKIPGPFILKFTEMPDVIGNLRGRAHESRIAYHLKYGDVVRIGPNTVSFGGADQVKQIMINLDLPKGTVYKLFRPAGGRVNLFSETDKAAAKVRRRLMANGFSVSYLKNVHPLILKVVETFCDVVDERIEKDGKDGEVVMDLYHPLSLFAADVIGESAFGSSFDLLTNSDNETEFANMIGANFRKAVVGSVFPFIKYIGFNNYEPLIDEYLRRGLQKRQLAGGKRNDLWQYYMDTSEANPKEFDAVSMNMELHLLVMAAGDTTSRALIFLIRLLVDHPEHLRTLENEITNAIYPNKIPIPASDIKALPVMKDDELSKLSFLDACIHETLRLFGPIQNGFVRIADKDCNIMGTYVPTGTNVVANGHVTHLDPKIYPNPNKWDPTRWLPQPPDSLYPDNLHQLSKHHFYPFSAGSRNCIGKAFAMTEMRFAMVMFLARFTLGDVVEGQSWDFTNFITLHFTDNRYLVRVKRRFRESGKSVDGEQAVVMPKVLG